MPKQPSHITGPRDMSQRFSSPGIARGGMLFEAWATYMIVQIDRKLNQLLGLELTDLQKEDRLMTAVQAQQEDLDNLGEKFEDLVTVVGQIDTSKLPDADLSKLNTALGDVAGAINSKLPVTTPVTDPTDGS